MAGNTDPLILVDGMIWGSPDDLMGLNPNSIDYVEVITRGVSTFGSRGANGVIAIYTKRGASEREFELGYDTYKIGGYSRPIQFSHPDYSESNTETNPDFRTTLYWNPYLTTGEGKAATVEFYAADVPTRYQVTVEGMTVDGKPFRGVSYITVTR